MSAKGFKKLFSRADGFEPDDPYEHLAAAIVKQAVMDYVDGFRRSLYGIPLSKKATEAKQFLKNEEEVIYLVKYSGKTILEEVEKTIRKEEKDRCDRRREHLHI